MSSSSSPSDLRVLCRKLSSIPPAQLPHALPALTRLVVQCRDALSAPQDQKPKDGAPHGAMLVNKLKTSILALLNGRSREARFAAVGLIKVLVDVGGWEILRASEPWVRGLLSIVQKGDLFAAKEIAVVTLTRIYLLLHPYQTLVREIATPTIPEFIKACLQLIKNRTSTPTSTTPFAFVEACSQAFSILIPSYPTIFRPFSADIRSAESSRRLTISIHHVAAKSGGGEEWAKLVDAVLKDLHVTADQVLRAVDESWQASGGYGKTNVNLDQEPSGGGAAANELPPWTGLSAGSERLIALFHYLSDCLKCPTKGPVNLPISALVDAISRVCFIARLSPKSQSWDQALEMNAAVGREEKEELWSLMPEIHLSAMNLMLTMFRRLGEGMLPVVPDVLDHLVRVFKSGMNIPAVRTAGYLVLDQLLSTAGPTLSKARVTMLEPLIAACCRDLQQDAGFLQPVNKVAATSKKDTKNMIANADLFLQPQASAAEDAFSLDRHHKVAADALLSTLLSSLRQQLLKPTLRGLLDKTAILTRNRDAMFSSVLNPYKDQRGRMYPSILPHLSRQFPEAQGLEILRTNMRPNGVLGGDQMVASLNEMEDEYTEDIDEEAADGVNGDGDIDMQESSNDINLPQGLPVAPQADAEMPLQSNPFEAKVANASASTDSLPKRKHEGSSPNPPKRQDVENKASITGTSMASMPPPPANEDEEGDDSDVSVHLNMELDDDDELEEDE
ncbi:hypothetical protein RJ55_03099 [Drechmeria coniospora]|nr:hypothetical protein RJ55_03099 [Drechmeria coniospora]